MNFIIKMAYYPSSLQCLVLFWRIKMYERVVKSIVPLLLCERCILEYLILGLPKELPLFSFKNIYALH